MRGDRDRSRNASGHRPIPLMGLRPVMRRRTLLDRRHARTSACLSIAEAVLDLMQGGAGSPDLPVEVLDLGGAPAAGGHRIALRVGCRSHRDLPESAPDLLRRFAQGDPTLLQADLGGVRDTGLPHFWVTFDEPDTRLTLRTPAERVITINRSDLEDLRGGVTRFRTAAASAARAAARQRSLRPDRSL